MGADMRCGILVIHIHPCQRVRQLAGKSASVPTSGFRILMIGKSRIERSCGIEHLVQIHQITFFLYGAKHAEIAFQKIIESILGHVHIRRKVLQFFINDHPFTVHQGK